MGFFAIPVTPEQAVAREGLRVIRDQCVSCHGAQKSKGGLVLSSRAGVLRGGDEGVVVSLQDPDSSRLWRALLEDADPHMPPKKQLSTAEIEAVRHWIAGGLLWDEGVFNEEPPLAEVALEPLPPTWRPALAVAFSPDGSKLASGRGNRVEIRDLSATNRPVIVELEAGVDAVRSLRWSADGEWLAAGSFRRVAIWSAADWAEEGALVEGLSGRVTGLRFSQDRQRLYAADSVEGRGGYLRVFNLGSMKMAKSWRAHAEGVADLDLSGDGRRLVTAGSDRLVQVWESGSGRLISTLEGHLAQVLGVAFNTNATQVASCGADRQLRVYDIATREKVSTLGNHPAAVVAVSWPAAGGALFALGQSGAVLSYRNLKSHTGEQSSASGDERRIGSIGALTHALAASEDGSMIATGGQDGVVALFDKEGKFLVKWESAASPSKAPAPEVLATRTEWRRGESTVEGKERWLGSKLPELSAVPLALRLEGPDLVINSSEQGRGLMLTAAGEDGFDMDATHAAELVYDPKGPFMINERREIVPLREGRGTFMARLDEVAIRVPVVVKAQAARPEPGSPTVSFVRDVLPRLNKAGCSAGSCHAKPEGQNGFKLTVFSYDPRADYEEIVGDSHGRRVFPAAPDESLLIQKPTSSIAHEGGSRFDKGSELHAMLLRWIREGMAYETPGEPSMTGIEIFPKDRRYHHGARQQLRVHATYSDGSRADVTGLAQFDSSDREIAEVDDDALLKIGQLTGQAVVVARFMGRVADSQIRVPAAKLLPEDRYANLPAANFIDTLAHANFKRMGFLPSDPASDSEFLRRAKLDAIGVLPKPEEVRAFLSDPNPDKRKVAIQQILDDPAYADHWANKWADLLRPNPDRVGVKSIFVLDQWLRESFRANKPYDQFVREILEVEGSNHQSGPAVIYRDRREPTELTTMFSQLFLGVRMECAKCHHHPNEKWAQEDFYEMAAYFGPVRQKGAGLSPPISAGRETFYFQSGGTVKHPITGAVMTPKPPDGPAYSGPGAEDPRHQLADWLLKPENPFFAKAAVNRVWAVFFGRGMVEPVDDFRISNPCANPELLDELARQFALAGYDFKWLMRTIMESKLYQLSSMPNETNLADTRNFSRSYRRRLPAEVLMDAVANATGVPDKFTATPIGSRASQAWSYKIESHFLNAFGRPNSSSDCPCERDTRLSVVQTLHLMNSSALQAKLTDGSGRAGKLAAGDSPPESVVEEIFLATLSRPPGPEELKIAVAAFLTPGATQQTACEDLLWALINSPEFALNH